MFFIVPSPPVETDPQVSDAAIALSDGAKASAPAAVADVNNYYRRRVAAACDRCRLKKARCSGGPAPCTKCKRDRVICVMSKGQKLDTHPKPPEYVRMVESQRDLLLQAVHSLRRKSAECQRIGSTWDATSDINKVLQGLGVHIDQTAAVRESIIEELATPQSMSSINPIPNPTVVSRPPPAASRNRITTIPASLRAQAQAIPNNEGNLYGYVQPTPESDAIVATEHPFGINDNCANQVDSTPLVNTRHNSNILFEANNTDYAMLDTVPLLTKPAPMPIPQNTWPQISQLPFFDFQDSNDLDYLNMDLLQQDQNYTWPMGSIP